MVRSKIKYTLFLGITSTLFLMAILINHIVLKPALRGEYFMLAIIVSCILTATILLSFKDYKYLVINREKRTLTWYSLYRPFGKTMRFEDYKYRIRNIDYNATGPYATMYLVGEDMYTKVRFTSFIYKNFEDLYDAIDLPEIKSYRFGVWLYLKLIFTGRIKIVE